MSTAPQKWSFKMKSVQLIAVTAIISLATTAIHAAVFMKLGDIKGEAVQQQAASNPGNVLPSQKPAPALLLPAVQTAQLATTPIAVLNPKNSSTTLSIPAVQNAKPATCGQGFTAIGLKLQKHEGKVWYEYQCVAEQQIIRTCNSNTSVTSVKDEFISLPSDEQSYKSRLQMSYKCFHYVPVK